MKRLDTSSKPFFVQKGNIYAVPVTHYSLEMAAAVNQAFHEIKPDCVAVELAETMELQLLHAVSRLPDLSVVKTSDEHNDPLYYLIEPCDGIFEGLRLALENGLSAHCIDLDLDDYPEVDEALPDPYSVHRIGLKAYYEAYLRVAKTPLPQDEKRELHMARRLKELSFRYDKILFVGGMHHCERILDHISKNVFPDNPSIPRKTVEIATLSEDSAREVMAECGWISTNWEEQRNGPTPPDKQKLWFSLLKSAGIVYEKSTANPFPSYNLRNTLKLTRNWALLTGRLLPDLYQLLTAAKGCVDANYAYETWKLATEYKYLKNVDGLEELTLSAEEIWGRSKKIRFQLKQQNPKSLPYRRRKKDRSFEIYKPPGKFSICSYPPEDVSVENFGEFLKKKATQLMSEEGARTMPFTTSLEDGIDTRETTRHFSEKKLYVKARGKPPGGVGSLVVIFHEDFDEDDRQYTEKYPWRTTWIGEHSQESDMSFYATPTTENVVGPGISRCEYGGFMLSYPPRRLHDVWHDPDYFNLKTKSEVLLAAAIDYSVKPVIVYVASKPPRSIMKSYASRFGKKVVYIPIGQLSPVTLNKLRAFHVLDSHGRRDSADEYIF